MRPFHPYQTHNVRLEDCFLLPCLAAHVAMNRVAVSDCAALWCPDFPHCLRSAAIRPAQEYYTGKWQIYFIDYGEAVTDNPSNAN